MFLMKIKYIAALTVIAFLVHVVWENAQAPLYAGYQSLSQHFSICFIGTLGDVFITLLVLAFFWLLKRNVPRTGADFLALAIIGFVIAVGIEQNALLLGTWQYAPTMPLIPYLQVGFTPILQMTLLLPFSFYVAKLFYKKSYAKI